MRIRTRFLLLVSLLLLIAGGFLLYRSYERIRKSLEADYHTRINQIAQILARNTDYLVLKRIIEEGKKDEQILLLPAWLDLREKMRLLNILLITKEGKTVFSLVEEEPPLGERRTIEAVAPVIGPREDTLCFLKVVSSREFLEPLYSLRRQLLLFTFSAVLFFSLVLFMFVMLERRHYKLKESLQRASVYLTMSRVAGALAHEIKNPLFVIRGNLELLKNEVKDEKLIISLVEEVDRINQTILKYEKLGEFEDKKSEVNLGSVIHNILTVLNHRLKKRNIEIRILMDEEIILETSPGAVQGILFNLILNAMEAVERNGLIEISARREGKKVFVAVRDNGKGIDKKEVEHIFEPFYTTRPGGTGLGLFVVKQLIEEVGGDIEIESKKGEGTTVKVILKGA